LIRITQLNSIQKPYLKMVTQ